MTNWDFLILKSNDTILNLYNILQLYNVLISNNYIYDADKKYYYKTFK